MAFLRFLATLTFGITVSTTMTFTAGPPTQSNSTLVANPNTVVANGTASVPLTFTAVDFYGNLAPGVAVTLSGSGGNNTFAATSGTTNASGVFATTLTSTYAQAEAITASFGTSSSITTIVQFVPGAASSATSSLVLSPNTQVANNSNTILASLTLCDANGNPIPNVTSTFTASGTSTTVSSPQATSTSGQSSATYQTTLAQNENALVTAGGLSFIAPMVFVPGPPAAAASTLAASPNIAAGKGLAAISLVTTVRDAQGNAVSGASVALSASGGNNTFTAATGNTTGSGTYTTTLKSTLMQTETITALIAGSISEAVSVTFTGNANATTSSLVLNPNTQTVGPSNVITATLTLRDAASNPLAGVASSWSASGGNNTIVSAVATSSSGVGTASYSSTLAQNENIVVVAGGISLTLPATFTPGSPNATTSYLYAIPTRQIANNSNVITASLMLNDAYNNAIPGQTPTFTASGSNTIVSDLSVTSSTGLAQANYQTGTIQNENTLVSVGGFTLSRPIIFTDIPAQCSLTLNPNMQTADGNSAIGITAMVTNNSNQPVPDVQVIFSSSGAAQMFSSQNVITTAAGQARSNLISFYAGSNTITAQAANVHCVGQGNFLTHAAYCASSPNYNVMTYTTDSKPNGLVAGDFDGDGNLDLVVANYNSGTIGVFLGASTGAFQPQVSFAAGKSPRAVVAADFNGDGNLDIAVANYGSNTVGVLLGTGTGSFRTQIANATAVGTYALANGDFDGDGQTDLAVTAYTGNTVGVLLGTGLGTFQAVVNYTTGSTPSAVAVADLNSDGKQDLVVTNRGAANIGVFLGTGLGTFQTPVTSVTKNAPQSVVVGDFNGDGMQDVAVTNYSSANLSILLGMGTGAFQTQATYATNTTPYGLTAGDFNGDGKQDLAVGNNYNATTGILLGSGTGAFQAQTTYATGNQPYYTVVGDFNRDGKQDFAVINNGNNTVGVYLTVCP